jgi:hypothetical protein
MRMTGLPHGRRLLKLVDFPVTEVLGPEVTA